MAPPAASPNTSRAGAEPPSLGDYNSYEFLDHSSGEIDSAAAANDFRRVGRLMDEQLSEVMQGLLLEDFGSGNVGSLATRSMVGANPEVNLAAVSLQIARRNQALDDVLASSGWAQVQAFSTDILKRYKERNGADKVTMRAGMTEQEMAEASMQFEPVMVDPNEVANYRQQLAKIDQQLRPFGTSVFTDPRTARIAQVIQNSAEPGRPGYLADAEQDLNQQLDPFTKYVGLPVVEGVDAFVEGAAQVGVGVRSLLHDMGVVSLDGLSQGNADALYNAPTSWVQDSDGTWYHNGGKVGAAEVYAGIWYGLTGELIDQQMADYADAKARMAMQASGVQGLTVGLGQFMGSMGAFLGTGGPAMKAGAYLTKGLGIAVTGGKAAKSLSRTEKLVRILAERSGAAAALGALEATKSGRVEGYGKAMLHGTIMAVPMMVMGAVGDRLERTLRRYKHLPGPIAAGLAGTVEGIGLDLGTWDAGFQFVRDPSDETFSQLVQQVMVNSIGNGLLRGSGITGAPPVHEFALPPDQQRARKMERRAQAAGGDPVEVATQRGAEPETVARLGKAVAETRASVGTAPEVAMASAKEAREAERQLDVEEAGLTKSEPEKLESRYATREELDRLKAAPNTPEKRAEIIKLLNSSRAAFGKDFAGFVKKVADEQARGLEAEQDAAKQLMEGADVVKALLGDRDASSYKAERKAKLAEQLEAQPQHVEGAEPRPLEPIASKSKITPLGEMVQEGGRTGLEPDATLPPKGPPAPRPVTPEQALTEGLDPETGVPDVVQSRQHPRKWDEQLSAPEGWTRRRWTQDAIGTLRIPLNEHLKKQDSADVEAAGHRVSERSKWYRSEIATLEGDVKRGQISPDDVPAAIESLGIAKVRLQQHLERAQMEFDHYRGGGKVIGTAQGDLAKKFPNWSDVFGPQSNKVTPEVRARWAADEIREIRESLKRIEQLEAGLRSYEPGDDDATPDVVELNAPKDKMPGQPASLRMRPDLETEGVPGTKKIRASDVILDLDGFEGDVVQGTTRKGVGIRGRASTKGVLGWYHTREDLTRLRDSRAIVVKVHEHAHNFDVKLNASSGLLSRRSQLTPDQKRGFIAAAHPWYPDYDKLPRRSQEMESWAEFWARYMLGDPTLKADTGAFYDWAMNWLASPQRARFLPEMQRRIETLRQYRDQGSVQRGEASIGFFDDAKSIQELKAEGIMKDTATHRAAGAIRRTFRALHKVLFDDLADIKRSQEQHLSYALGKEKAEDIRLNGSITTDPTRLMDVWRMTATRQAERFLVTGTHDLAGNTTGKGIASIFKDVGGPKAYRPFMNWLAAKRRMEARAKGLVQGPTSRLDDLTIIEKLGNERFEQGAKELRAYWDRVIDYATEAGAFSAEQAAKIKGSYEFYIPFERLLLGPRQAGPGRGVAERGTGVKSMKGSTEEIRDPLNAMADMTRAIITKAQQAMVMKAAVLHGIVHNGVGGFITEVKRDVIPKDHPMLEVAKAIRDAEGGQPEAQDALAETIEKMAQSGAIGPSITLFGQQTIPKGSRPIIAYTPHFSDADLDAMTKSQRRIAEDKNNKLVWLELDVPAYEALMGLDVPPNIMDKMPPLVTGLARGAAYLDRLGATILNPVFLVANPVRDMAAWALTTRNKTLPGPMSIFSAIGAYAAGVRAVIKGTPSAAKMENLGAGVGTFFGQEFSRGRTAQELLGVNRGVLSSLRRVVGRLGDLMSKPELALRQREFKGAYDRARAEGKSDLEASLVALEAGQNITTNFARGGVLTRAMNSIIPYTTAKTNSAMRMAEVLAGRRGADLQRQAIVRGVAMLTIPSIALWWLNREEKWYQELPDWERYNNWHLKVPGSEEVVRIPKPFEWGKWFGSVPEAVLEQAFVEDPRSVIDTAWDATSSMLPSNFMPSLLQPFVESKSNYDFFRERPIVPDWLERSRLPQDQFTAYTRWYAKAVTTALGFAGLDLSPIRVERALDGMTGGLVGRSNDLATDLWALKKLVSDEDFKLSDTPILGRAFVRDNPFSQSRSVQSIFDLDKRLTQAAGSNKLTGQQQQAHGMVADAKEEISRLKAMAKAGTIDRVEADRRAAEVARRTLDRIQRNP